jgi:modulator of FtsH protease
MGFINFVKTNPIMFFVGWLIISIILIFTTLKNQDNEIGKLLYFAFSAFCSPLLALGMFVSIAKTGSHSTILLAGAGTILICSFCILHAVTTKKDYSGIGGMLLWGTIGLIIIGIIGAFLKMTFLSILISVFGIALFSLWLVYDVQKAFNGGESSPIAAALGIFLDIINIFQHLLNLLSILGDISD